MQEYWTETGRFGGVRSTWNLELRSNIALGLIEKFGSVAAKIQGESSDGRWKLALQEPQELVDRCFAIADAFVVKAEERGGVRLQDNENDSENKEVA